MPTTPQPTEAPEPRPSATVVLIRGAVPAPEIFMVKRHERSSFGSAHAFPGGVLEAADADVHDRCEGLSPADANAMLGLEKGGLDYYSAAIRELFEESGVLLADTRFTAGQLPALRARLNDGTLTWDAFAKRGELVMHCDALNYFSFWITPTALPKRYSTRFFLAELPAGQSADHCGGELTDSCWMSAAECLRAHKQRTMIVHYPTRKTLERLTHFDSAEALLEWARRCGKKGVVCDQPAFAPELLR